MLIKKIAVIEEEVEEQETETKNKNGAKQRTKYCNVVGKSVLKVLTSATFIRGAFGILTKMFKK